MPKSLQCVACATGDQAIPALEAVLDAGHEIVRIISHVDPDETLVLPEERMGSTLGTWAGERGIEVGSPAQPGSDEYREGLIELAPDLGLVVAYGRELPPELLEVPRSGWLKAHFSLLPKHRGLHPVRSALWRGDKKTGVSVIEVTEENDAGPILDQELVEVDDGETFGSLSERLAPVGAELLARTVDLVAAGSKIKKRKQNDKSASATPQFGRRHLKAPWWRKAETVAAHLRALSPEPGMTTMVRRTEIGIVKGAPISVANVPFGEAGTFLGVRNGKLAVLCSDNTVFGIEQARWLDGAYASPHEIVERLDVGVGNLFV